MINYSQWHVAPAWNPPKIAHIVFTSHLRSHTLCQKALYCQEPSYQADVLKAASYITDGVLTVISWIADHVGKRTVTDFMLHYVHRRLVFLTSGEVWAHPALRTSTATTSLPEGRRTHHCHRSPFRYVGFFLLLNAYKNAQQPCRLSFGNITVSAALPCRMSAASWFHLKMLPSFDCHTLERCSTPTPPFLSVAYICMITITKILLITV